MKRWFLYGAALVAAVLLMKEENRTGTDIAKLEPARILIAEEESGGVVLKTDAGHSGWGSDPETAVADMEMTAPGRVFLDTAEYLIVGPQMVKWMSELAKILRSSCQVCVAAGVTDLSAVTEYLSGHEPGYTLRQWQKGETQLPVLYILEERMYLAKP